MSGAIDVFIAYQFVKMLTTPWEKTDAYKLGIIDENGVILKKQRELETTQEKKAYTVFHRLVWNIKKLLEKIPAAKTRIASFAAALWLLKEHTHKIHGPEVNFDVVIDEFNKFLEEYRECLITESVEDINTLFEMEFDNNEELLDNENPILKAGIYMLTKDADTPDKPARAGTKLYVPSDIKAFDEIAGYPVFKVKHPIDGSELIISHDDLKRIENTQWID